MTQKLTAALQREMFNAVQTRMGPRSGLGAPVRDSFFQNDRGGAREYPLARLLSSRKGTGGGGRGGKTRVALYLSLIWVASGGEHTSDRPARFWAALLGLADPDGAGSRVVRSTWRELEARRLVAITPGDHSGATPVVRLLREDGSGEAYTIPDGSPGETYRRIPEFAWRRLFAEPDLTGAGLTMYLVAVRTAYRARQIDDLTFPSDYFRREYGLGESTRKNGLRNLCRLGVLEPHLRRVDDFGDPSQRARRRTTYDILEEYAPVQREHAAREEAAAPQPVPQSTSGTSEEMAPTDDPF